MPYQEETIKTIIDRLNYQYFLPSIQRNYVWKPNQIIMLFDSIMRGYPISSFLFWELEDENRDRWEIFKFCETAVSDGTHHIKQPTGLGVQNLTLVLDGQQRLTSMLIGLKGIYKIRANRQWRMPQFYPECRLFINLFSDAQDLDESKEFTGKPYYEFDWFVNSPKNDQEHCWFQVGKILDCKNDNGFYKMRDQEESQFPEGIKKEQENIFERNIWRFYEAIYKDPAISFYVERDQDYDRVLDIFVRANEGGTELTKPEIILSMLESKWSRDVNNHGAKSIIDRFIFDINENSLRKNSITLEFIMRTCLVLSNLPVQYRINTFTTKNIDLIESMWPDIQKAIRVTINLVNRFGLDKNNITGLNVLIPLVLYCYKNPGVTFLGSTPFEDQNASIMRKWLIMAMLNRVFGRGAEQVLSNLRHILEECKPSDDFPVSKINIELNRMRFITDFNERSIQSYFESTYPVEFLKISLLYKDHFWDVVSVQQDHIFPKSWFEKDSKEFKSLSSEKQVKYPDLYNKVGNLQLLISEENNEKRAKPFEQWITTRDADFKFRHLIPEDPELYKFENFEKFITARESLIAEKLKKLFE
jgi:uncharacterized protein with ParB-like and HNH nuclease domain